MYVWGDVNVYVCVCEGVVCMYVCVHVCEGVVCMNV